MTGEKRAIEAKMISLGCYYFQFNKRYNLKPQPFCVYVGAGAGSGGMICTVSMYAMQLKRMSFFQTPHKQKKREKIN